MLVGLCVAHEDLRCAEHEENLPYKTINGDMRKISEIRFKLKLLVEARKKLFEKRNMHESIQYASARSRRRARCDGVEDSSVREEREPNVKACRIVCEANWRLLNSRTARPHLFVGSCYTTSV